MPKLDNRPTAKLTLSDYEGAEIEIYKTFLLGDIQNLADGMSNYDQTILLLTKIIKSWNFTDEAGQLLPIDDANLRKLSLKAIKEITDPLEMHEFELKKN